MPREFYLSQSTHVFAYHAAQCKRNANAKLANYNALRLPRDRAAFDTGFAIRAKQLGLSGHDARVIVDASPLGFSEEIDAAFAFVAQRNQDRADSME